MKCLFLHAKEYQIKITGLATRPLGIQVEVMKQPIQKIERAIIAFVTVEAEDRIESIEKPLVDDLRLFANQTGESMIVLVPFAHLSNQLASSEKALAIFEKLHASLKQEFKVERTHFGSDKELMLHVFGHPGNIRFRQYT